MNPQPLCWIIAGPNGAGKTTFALDYLPEVAGCQQFVNADLIAAGLSPLNPERDRMAASRLFLAEIERCVQAREDFAFETTLSGRGYLRLADRRFGRSLYNLFQCYAHKVHRTRCYLNSGDTLVAVFVQSGDSIEVLDTSIYHHLHNKADL
ncbi:MAG TPA: hypothetical protein VIP51_14760 [Eoetvoesiella sp.]